MAIKISLSRRELLRYVTMVTGHPRMRFNLSGKSSASQSLRRVLLQRAFLPGQNYISCRLTCGLHSKCVWRGKVDTYKHTPTNTQDRVQGIYTAVEWQPFVGDYWIHSPLNAYLRHSGWMDGLMNRNHCHRGDIMPKCSYLGFSDLVKIVWMFQKHTNKRWSLCM